MSNVEENRKEQREEPAAAEQPPPVGASAVADERRILVAVDESEESAYALRWCLRNLLAARKRNIILLLYAKPPPPVYSSLDGTGYLFSDEVITTMEKYSNGQAGSVIEKAKNVCKEFENSNLEVKEKVAAGDARDVICDMVEKLGADLLVMGSHGYGFIQRTLLGSVSDYCLRNANCPVMIVKRPAN